LVAASSAHATPTWLPAFDLGFPATQVVMGSDGTTVYAGSPQVGGFYRVTARVRPPGGPLGPVQYLSPDGISVQGFSIATGGDGRVVAAWVDSSIVKTAVLPARGTTFGDPEPIPTTPGETPGNAPAVAVDGIGDVLLLWTAGAASAIHVRFGERPASGATPATQLIESVGYGPNESIFDSYLHVAAADDGSALL
jgi:hypothetical protein